MTGSLFGLPPADPAHNLLPCDGALHDYGIVLPAPAAQAAFAALQQQIEWQPDWSMAGGKRQPTRRQVAWHGDQPYAYTYSGHTRHARPWTPGLLALKALVQQQVGAMFNSCLLNLYHDGSEGMAWHSDAETALVPGGPIASLSLGAARRFAFRHRQRGLAWECWLQPGQLVVMAGATQQHWQHAVLKNTGIHDARISLTFRQIAGQGC